MLGEMQTKIVCWMDFEIPTLYQTPDMKSGGYDLDELEMVKKTSTTSMKAFGSCFHVSYTKSDSEESTRRKISLASSMVSTCLNLTFKICVTADDKNLRTGFLLKPTRMTQPVFGLLTDMLLVSRRLPKLLG